MEKKKIETEILPSYVTMQSIEYNWFGKIKKITFRTLEEINQLPQEVKEKLFTESIPPIIVTMKK